MNYAFFYQGLNSTKLKGIDGKDQWNSLTHKLPSPRSEFLYNIGIIDTTLHAKNNYKML